MDSGRGGVWLPLLRALTEATSDWVVWKNVDSALHGTGDVDSAAPRRAWPIIVDRVGRWAQDQSLGPTIVCRHIPRTLNLLTLLPEAGALLQLEVKAGATFRGSVQFHAEDVLALSHLDDRGFRQLRPGAEGVLKLMNNGMMRGARVDQEGLEAKHVPALLGADPDGVRLMAARFGPARGALLTGVDAVLAGGWDRRAMATVEAWALAKALAQPHVVAERVWFRAVTKRRCPVLGVVYRADRRVQGDVSRWLDRAAASHRVMAPS